MANCSMCGKDYDPANIAKTHPYRHPVNGAFGEVAEKEPKKQELQFPTDPILRVVLISKGILTLEDIEEAEATLKATGMVIGNPEATPMKLFDDAEGS